jgi:copper(I)-binding protein/putative intracellular protease/amidase
MQRKIALMCLLVMALSTAPFIAPTAGVETNILGEEYVCPPCGCGSDDKVYDKAGFCPVCGMKLVLRSNLTAVPAPATSPTAPKKAAILLFDGVQIIDYTGPYEVFGQAGMQVFTVATSTAQITTNMGMKVTPHYALDDAPPADVLLIPGGGVVRTQQDARVLDWIRERSKQTEYVVSVCNGAYILAKTGLLDGLTATTTAPLIDGLPTVAPKVRVVRDQRYVDNGKFITTAGLSSGIDGALHVVSKLFGKGQAQLVALGMEYDWKGDSTYARANLADRHITNVFGRGLRLPAPQGTQSKLQSTAGTAHNWEVQWQVAGDTSAADALKLLNDKLAAGGWAEQKTASRGATRRVWKFNDADGGQWTGVTEAQVTGSRLFILSLKIERTGIKAANKPINANVATDKLVIHDGWIQEMPPSTKFTAAHLVIENRSGKETALVGAKADIAGTIELHRAETDNGMMRMRKLDRIPLPTGRTDLTGDLHIMLIDLKAPLKEGEQVALTLEFENGLRQNVTIPVKRRQAE